MSISRHLVMYSYLEVESYPRVAKKQTSITLSTMEMKFIACSTGVQEAIWLREFLEDLCMRKDDEGPVTVYCNSQAGIVFTKALNIIIIQNT